MKDLMVEAGYKSNFLDFPEGVELVSPHYLETGYYWLRDIHGHEWRAAKGIKDLLKQEIWDRYDTWGGYEDHAEMRLRKETRKALKLRYKTRPLLFRKGKLANVIKKAKAKKTVSNNKKDKN